MSRRSPLSRALCIAAAAALMVIAQGPAVADDVGAQKEPVATTFLGFRFIENASPITPEEKVRLGQIEDRLKTTLEQAGAYKFTPVPDATRAKIAAGQPVGECGGCEIDYGKELGVPIVMWGTVQKVSNLILNMNIYMADVARNKMTFVKSVDIRGNTDETWSQGMNYMIKRYILKTPGAQKDK